MPATTAHSLEESALAPLATPGAHVVHFYRDDDVLVATLGRLVRESRAAGDAVVAIVTAAHRDAVTRSSPNFDDGRCVILDADDVLGRVVVHGRLVARRFDDAIGPVIERAERAAPSGKVRAFGELVTLLCRQGRYDLALHLEEFWSDLLGERRFSLLCAYPLGSFTPAHGRARRLAVCGWHSHVSTADDESIGVPHGLLAARPDEALAVTCRWCAQSLFAASRIAEAEAAVILEHLRNAHPQAVAPDTPPTLGGMLREVRVDRRR